MLRPGRRSSRGSKHLISCSDTNIDHDSEMKIGYWKFNRRHCSIFSNIKWRLIYPSNTKCHYFAKWSVCTNHTDMHILPNGSHVHMQHLQINCTSIQINQQNVNLQNYPSEALNFRGLFDWAGDGGPSNNLPGALKAISKTHIIDDKSWESEEYTKNSRNC